MTKRSLTYCLPLLKKTCQIQDNVLSLPIWFSIHDQMELFNVDLDMVRLMVQTVPATDPVTLQEHTAYTVIAKNDGSLLVVPGWTLRDAIETFCDWFQIDRKDVCLHRPFIPQSSFKL